MPRTIIRRLALTSATGGVLVLAGCSAVDTNGDLGASQATPLAETVTVSQPFCVADEPILDFATFPGLPGGPLALRRAEPAPDPDCGSYTDLPSGPGGAGSAYTTEGGGRLLVAVQVADGTSDPELRLRRRPSVTFTPEPGALAKLPAAPAGRRWIGYRSSDVRFAPGEENAGDVVDAVVAIPRSGDRPASDELVTDVAIGDQVTANGFGAEYPADRAVDCDEDLSDTPNSREEISTTTCPGQKSGQVFGNNAPATDSAAITPTDAAITTPGQETAVQAGQTASVPFQVQRSGDAPDGAELALTASTSVPGGQADPSVGTLPWEDPAVEEPPVTTTEVLPPTSTDEIPTETLDELPATSTVEGASRAVSSRAIAPRTSDVTVAVAVPATTAAGVYDVVLKTADEGGERSATARIRVSAAPAQTPAPAAPAPAAPATPAAPRKPVSVTVKLLRSTKVSRRTRRLHLGRVTCVRDSGSCTVRTKVRVGKRTIGSVTLRIRPNTSAGVTLRLSKANLKRLVARRATATTTVTADGSDPVVRTTKVAAKRP